MGEFISFDVWLKAKIRWAEDSGEGPRAGEHTIGGHWYMTVKGFVFADSKNNAVPPKTSLVKFSNSNHGMRLSATGSAACAGKR